MASTMGRRATLTVVGLALALGSAPLVGTVPQAPGSGRDRPVAAQAAPRPSGTLSGRVTIGTSDGPPARRTTVLATGPAIPSGRMAVSDEMGAFHLTDLPAGPVTLRVSRPGFVTSYYGARLPWRGPGTPIVVDEGEAVDGLVLPILPGAVIAGRVIDEFGQPAPDVRVVAMEERQASGQQSLLAPVGASAATDDRGEFRLFGLSPGDLIVSAIPNRAAGPARVTTPAQTAWIDALSGQPDGTPRPTPPSTPTVKLAPIYYPGTPDPAAAVPLRVTPGNEILGIDLRLEPVSVARVEGRLLQADGRPGFPPQQVILASASGLTVIGVGNIFQQSRVDASGGFSIDGVLPGAYVLAARGSSTPPGPPVRPSDPAADLARPRPDPDLWASLAVTVGGQDLTGLQLVLRPGLTISGRVVFNGDSRRVDSSRISVALGPADGSVVPVLGASSTPVNEDGTFEISNVVPGPYVLRSSVRGTSAWILQSATIDDREAADLPIEIGMGDGLRVVVTFTDRPASIEGRITDVDGQPAPGFSLVLFSTDARHWFAGSRRTRTLRPADDGSFSASGLPPGSYHLAALTDGEPADLGDATFLEQVAAASVPVMLVAGETTRQDIGLAGR